jgi:hypothetical protein
LRQLHRGHLRGCAVERERERRRRRRRRRRKLVN